MFKQFRLLSLLILALAATGMSFGQTGVITGRVTDISGNPLIGATIVLDGTTLGTASDIEGNYNLNRIPAGGYTIRVSSVGYKPQTRSIQISENQTINLDFRLDEDVMNMEELVVVGYGTKRKRNITSAIAKVKAQEIENVSVPSFEAALQGRSSGVQVTSDNGLAGAPITIRVRDRKSTRLNSSHT